MSLSMFVRLVRHSHEMKELDPKHHFFRHIGASFLYDDGSIGHTAFRLKQDMTTGQLEDGLSVNWVEYFGKADPKEAIAPLRSIIEGKGRKVGAQSKFALLNVDSAKAAAAKYINIVVVPDAEPNDASHALVKGYETFNDQVALELAKVVIATYPAKE